MLRDINMIIQLQLIVWIFINQLIFMCLPFGSPSLRGLRVIEASVIFSNCYAQEILLGLARNPPFHVMDGLTLLSPQEPTLMWTRTRTYLWIYICTHTTWVLIVFPVLDYSLRDVHTQGNYRVESLGSSPKMLVTSFEPKNL